MRLSISVLIVLLLLLLQILPSHAADRGTSAPRVDQGVQFRVTVLDRQERVPIELARVVLRREGRIVTQGATNPAGQLMLRDVAPGDYTLVAWFVGYRTYTGSVHIDPTHASLAVSLAPEGSQQQEVEVVGERELGVTHLDPAGNQVFESETYHAPPTARMNSLIQENLTGAVRAPTGEVHIRGEHGEFTYYVDGIPVPLGVFGGLNEVVDPKVIDRTTFITGGFPAEYGGQMTAVIDLNNRVPTGTFHLDASTYGGSYLTFNGARPFKVGGILPVSAADTLGPRIGPFRALNSNGQALSFSDHVGKLGFFVSGSRQETDRRIDPPVADIFHDHGFDYFLYGKFDYVLSDVDFLTANLNFGRTLTQVPYDSLEGITDDVQRTTNSFEALSYFRTLSAEADQESNFFLGAYARQGGLQYTPGGIDVPNFQFLGDTLHSYTLAEGRSFNTAGLRTTFDKRLSHHLMYKVGLNFSSTTGTDQFTSRDSLLAPGPSIMTDFVGSDFGLFAETEWHPFEWTSFDLGLRYDQHIAPGIPLQKQWSPRLRWNFLIDEDNTAYLYYGRMFMPTNIEGLRTIAVNVSNSLTPTLPERADFYEAVYTHAFPNGLRGKLAGYYRRASPGIDDQTVGNTAIKTPVNIALVRITGLELSLSYSAPETPLSGYVNAALNHAYGSGSVTGGFLDIADDGPATDLDHDQRLSMVVGINYQPRDWFCDLTGIYGSGLTNGNPNGDPYKTGLFDFNTAQHTSPSWIFNLSAGRTFRLGGGATIEPAIFITNIFDHQHLIKGAYFSAASWEEPRNVIFKLSVHV